MAANVQSTIVSLQNDGPKIIAVCAVMFTLAFDSVLLRLLAKSHNVRHFGIDDVLIGISMASYFTSSVLIIRGVDVGRHAVDASSPEYATYQQLVWGYSFLYWTTVAFATLSVLALCRRIFTVSGFFRISSIVVILLTLGWWISGTVADGVSYQPTAAWWDTSIKGGYIIDYHNFWLASMVAELCLEAATLALPIREVANLHMSRRKRALLMVIFSTGGLVLVSGCIRIYYIYSDTDSGSTAGTIWLSVHSGIAVISACLPTFKALLPREAESVVSGSSGKGSNASRSFASKHLLRFAAKMGSKGSSRASASAESSRERGSSDRLAPHAAGPGATRWSSETRRALALSPAAGRPGEAPLEMTRRNYSAQPRTAFHTPFKQSSLTPHS